jgi:hypothetical protein
LTWAAQKPSAVSVGKLMNLKNHKTGRNHAHEQVILGTAVLLSIDFQIGCA